MHICRVLLLVVFFLSSSSLIFSPAQACDSRNLQNNIMSGLAGGYSAPHAPTAEEKQILEKVWKQSVAKCADLPENHDKVKICSVRKQVVAGMNYEYQLSDEHRNFKLVVYVPLGNQPESVTSCLSTAKGS